MPRQQLIDPATQSRDSVGELVCESAIPRLKTGDRRCERNVESTSTLDLFSDSERREAPGTKRGQSSIPLVGDDGTAISRDGIRPARKAKRPATTACLIA
jgi:hypothetical protein